MGLELRTGNFGEYYGNTYDSSQALTQSQMELNAKYIYSSLSSQGWTLNSIAGILGNMQSESSINPGRWEGNVVGGAAASHGYGLVQWTPYTKYTEWIVNQGYSDPSTMDSNLFRIVWEVQNNQQWIATSSYNYSFEEFTKSTDSSYNLALAFLANYERPADPNQPIRGTQAEDWFKFLSGETPTPPTPPTPTPSAKIKKQGFKWAIYSRKLRSKREI